MNKKIVTVLAFLLVITNSYAGWYECFGYKGKIDKYPISLSFQIKEGYFGEKNKKNFNLIGVYKYESHNNPIRLEGKLDFKKNKVLLYEINNGKYTATFEFEFSKDKSVGVWTNLATNKQLSLELSNTSILIDQIEENEFNNIEILQAASFTEFYFIGEYSKKENYDKAQMDRLKIINKKDNTVFQIIDFSKIKTLTGNIMTIIFDNVEIIDTKKKQFIVWNDVGRMGGYLTITFNSKTKKFKLDPNPVIDGPN
ncbi:hypothetical protein [Flavobacterium branchiicola]|uniref:DUF3108 domain-containing protein n=1 Tax=Flavobacterium branchiicola TaxID=1114875 RepID=A0ABV9PIL3_9FLAO|nr:hypothetical protein [Flavobacterium branchiicola]MBS7256310.1 hypothetical protein [Flavobacterium branchiicola]